MVCRLPSTALLVRVQRLPLDWINRAASLHVLCACANVNPISLHQKTGFLRTATWKSTKGIHRGWLGSTLFKIQPHRPTWPAPSPKLLLRACMAALELVPIANFLLAARYTVLSGLQPDRTRQRRSNSATKRSPFGRASLLPPSLRSTLQDVLPAKYHTNGPWKI